MFILKIKTVFLGIFIAFLAWVGMTVAEAASLPSPKDKPILIVSGKILVTNKGDTAEFDRAMLEAMGMQSFTTRTPWYPAPTKFEGVPLAKVMEQLGATGEHFMVTALNDYSSNIPIEDIKKYNVLLALKVNDQYISVRDKGPIFIIYPFDTDPDLQHQTYYGRSVWQVHKITVK